MTKLCSVCGTENREEAQFCRACGTAFTAAAPPSATSDGDSASNVCAECGFRNKPGLRYCANCGASLAAAAAGGGGAAVGEASGGIGPPPISYPSFATVGPYPPAPSTVPDLPDADAEIALRQQEASDSGAMPFENAPSPSRAPLLIGIVALVLVVGGALAWTFMRSSNPSPPAIGVTAPPVAATLPAASAAPPPVTVEATPAANAPATSAAAVATPPAAASAGVLGAPPAAAAPLPHVGDAVPAPSPDEVEAKRLAAEKRRERAARDKADRDAKALAQQRDQSEAAAQRAEQDAAARRRAEEAQRARSVAAAPPPAAPAQPRGVREICAGRNAIAEAICQSRQCGQTEHAGEAICRQLREQEERRRNMQP
ncbi:MAG TPA: zinc-ribbon domain-containing protein [Caldimonas sp.]|nr:zinc-ribbon domain-containing protein [Caldimonas sp.]HEX4232888.1 zinc-ribbon domain-containing protein [Caldimonas sp.]